MSTKRESIFHCSCTVGARRFSADVLAWDEEDARRVLRAELGLPARTAIRVSRPQRELPALPALEQAAAG